ncbi:MAG: GGDEF domain-containing response regulator [Candidatus Omnitrophica bacterium]|nr:GGDEF domain-containing response regulator [Candidatus Omnitrophota bacterium]
MEKTVRVLLIEDDSDYAALMVARLSRDKSISFDIQRAEGLEEGLKRIGAKDIDIVLLDLNLPDSHGLDTLVQFKAQAANIPVLVLTGLDDESIAVEAVRRGAQDYLLKGEADGKMLPRVIRYALERHRMQEELRNLALVDLLTGLYNRRGFFASADQQIKLAIRTKREFLLLLADLDGLKQINDAFGHPEGDQALVRVAEILKITFRGSDILARIGGDEFAIFAVEAVRGGVESLLARLKKGVDKHNSQANGRYRISLSVGFSHFDPSNPSSLDQLIAQADSDLYRDKQTKSKPQRA